MLYSVLAFFLFAVPFFTWQGWADGIRFPKENLSIIGFLAIIGTSFSLYRLRPFKNKWLFLFLGWCFLLTIINFYLIPVYLEKVVLDMPTSFIAYKELFYITLITLTIVCLASIIPKERRVKDFRFFEINFKETLDFQAIAKVVSWVVIIVSVYSFIQALGLDEIYRCADPSTGWVAQTPLTLDPIKKLSVGDMSRRSVATMGNPSILAVFVSMCLPLCLYLRQKLGYIAFLSGLGVIGLTLSFTAILGLIAGLTVYLWFNHKKILLWLLVLAIPITFYLSGSQKFEHKLKHFLNPTGRVEVHKEAWKLIVEKPMFGFGLGSFEYLIGSNPHVLSRLNNQSWKELHDEYGQIWFTTGFIGLTLFLGFIVSSVRQFLKNITDESVALLASLTVFLVMSFGYFNFRVAPISFYGAVFTGLFLNVIGEGI